jgi:hypothetical protein
MHSQQTTYSGYIHQTAYSGYIHQTTYSGYIHQTAYSGYIFFTVLVACGPVFICNSLGTEVFLEKSSNYAFSHKNPQKTMVPSESAQELSNEWSGQ